MIVSLGENESAKFRASVLNSLRNRGVQDILAVLNIIGIYHEIHGEGRHTYGAAAVRMEKIKQSWQEQKEMKSTVSG